jgi:hypothetical protein
VPETPAGVHDGGLLAPERAIVGFTRLLRATGLDVPVGSTLVFACAVAEVGIDSRDAVYWAGHATLVRRPEDIATYDRAFAAWWDRTVVIAPAPAPSAELTLAFDTDDGPPPDEGDDGEGEDTPAVTVRYSPAEVLRQTCASRVRSAGRGEPVRATAGPGPPTCAEPSGARCAPGASRSTARSSSRANAPAGSCCSAT